MPTVARSNGSAWWTTSEPYALSARAARLYHSDREMGLASTGDPPYLPGSLPERVIWENIGSSRVRASEALLRALGRFYHLKDPAEILRFLGKEGRLLPFLFRIYPPLRRCFGTRKMCLEVVADPEFEDERLGVFVVLDGTADDALELLEKFDEEWWPEVPGWVERSLMVSVEFE